MDYYLYYGDWVDAFYPVNGYRSHTLYGIDISNSSNIIIGAAVGNNKNRRGTLILVR